MMKIIYLWLALLFSTQSWCLAAATIAPEALTVTQRTAEAFIIQSPSYGTNIGLIKTATGVVLIDPMPGEHQLAALDTLIQQLVGEGPRWILNTHAHPDHSGGNAYFIGSGAVLLDDTRQFDDIVQVVVTSHSVREKIFYHKKSNSIFVGDIYDSSWHPTFYAGGVAGFSAAIEAVLKLGREDSLIVPGHGKASGKSELRLFKQQTLDWIAQVRRLKAEGKTVDEIKQDPHIKLLLAKFNRDNKPNFVPDKALSRFIERTLALSE